MSGMPPGPRTPGIVNALRFTRDPLGFIIRKQQRHGEIFSLNFTFFGRCVYLASPELVKELFTGSPDDLRAGASNAVVLEPAVGPFSVLTLDGAEHMRQRKLLLAPFHGRALDHYREVILDCVRRDIETWPVGGPFTLHPHMQRVTLEVIMRAVYGIVDPDQLERSYDVTAEFAIASNALLFPRALRSSRWGPWKRFLRARAALDEMIYEEITARRAASDADERDDVLSLLMRSTDEDGTPLTDSELRDELVTIVGAGHETTATALSWAIERLVRTPDVLARLRSSLEDPDDDGAYLDAVIKETLRIRPVIDFVARRTMKPVQIGGYTVPADRRILAGITALHFREDLYPSPWEFRPERYLENGAADTYTWIPFGGGVRRCLGAAFAQEEMRIMLREIVGRAELAAVTAADERVVMRNITLAPADGARVVLVAPLAPTGGTREAVTAAT